MNPKIMTTYTSNQNNLLIL